MRMMWEARQWYDEKMDMCFIDIVCTYNGNAWYYRLSHHESIEITKKEFMYVIARLREYHGVVGL